MREFGEKRGIEHHDFPSDDARHRENIEGRLGYDARNEASELSGD